MLGILIAASLCAFAIYRNLTVYLLVSILLPTVIGLFCKYQLVKSDLASTVATFTSTVVLSASMMAYGSYFRTFIDPGQGFLIGGGWGSVISASLFGSITGAALGLLSMLSYMVARAIIELIVAKSANV